MAEERAQRGRAPRDRRGGEALAAEVGQVALEVLDVGLPRRAPEPGGEMPEVATVGVDGPRRPPRGEECEEAFELGSGSVCAIGPGGFAAGADAPARRHTSGSVPSPTRARFRRRLGPGRREGRVPGLHARVILS